jgi:hypothetical protein
MFEFESKGWHSSNLGQPISSCLDNYFQIAVRKVTGSAQKDFKLSYASPECMICFDEVKDILHMSKFDPKAATAIDNHDMISVSPQIVSDLRQYISLVAATYRNNPFHNFSHACHVTLSVNKLLKRIVAPDLTAEQLESFQNGAQKDVAVQLHDFSHGIISDPMAIFAITFAALIHDADHRGVTNVQLIKEEPDMGTLYRNKSVAEQNSVDVAWYLLMLDQFEPMRQYIFGTQAELLRFRQIVVNVVLATDIFDKELNDLRRNRWERAFSEGRPGQDRSDLRATIVMEHIIQASDVSHTMQHWHVYQKWNKHLFRELYVAHKAGRLDANPATFWYQGELGFFDNYVIPLAKKLKECNVFGVSSDEYLDYALSNRAEWQEKGQELVKGMVEEMSK